MTPKCVVYEAKLKFLNISGEPIILTFLYLANTPEQAIDSAYKCAADRIKNLPDTVAAVLSACEVSQITVRPLAEDGSYLTHTHYYLHRWDKELGEG